MWLAHKNLDAELSKVDKFQIPTGNQAMAIEVKGNAKK